MLTDHFESRGEALSVQHHPSHHSEQNNQHGHGHIQGLQANENKNGRRRGDQNENEDWSHGFEQNFDVILYKLVKLLKEFCS